MASETRLKEIKAKAAAAGLADEFDEMIRDLIAREQRAIDAGKAVESLTKILQAVGVAIGINAEVAIAHFAQIPARVKSIKAQLDSGGNTIRAETIKGWLRGYLEGFGFKAPDEVMTPEECVRYVALELRNRVIEERKAKPAPEPTDDGESGAKKKRGRGKGKK